MEAIWNWAARVGLIALAGLALPACGQSVTVTPPLLSDGFTGTFPGTTWTAASTTGTVTVAIDSTHGAPAPSLAMTATAAASTASTMTQATFTNPPLTISVAMGELANTQATDQGTGTVTILNPAAIATATWNAAAATLTFHITGGSADQSIAVTNNGTTFQQVTFSVSSSGMASWSVNGGPALVTLSGFPGGPLQVELSASFPGSTFPTFFFDNVDITSP